MGRRGTDDLLCRLEPKASSERLKLCEEEAVALLIVVVDDNQRVVVLGVLGRDDGAKLHPPAPAASLARVCSTFCASS